MRNDDGHAAASSAPVAELVAELGADVVLTARDAVSRYREDRAHDPNASDPLAVVRARDTADVQTALRWATRHGIPVVPRGAGTGLSGGASARANAIVVTTERMRDLVIDPVTRIATVGPGLLNAELKAAAAAEGLWYPPDPASWEICSIGGNVATNAGGLCCVKYGVTADYVLGLELVLADGTAITLGGPLIKDVAGLSLTRLLVGSEGTLGIITSVVVRLVPAPPPARTVVATFGSPAAAGEAVLAVAATLRPSMLEYMDRSTVRAVEAELHMGLDTAAAATIVARTEVTDPARDDAAAMVETLRAAGATVAREVTGTEADAYVRARQRAIPAVERTGRLLLGDVGVGLRRLADLLAGAERIAQEHDVTIAMIAHAGDGNTHPLVPLPEDIDGQERAHRAYAELTMLAVSLGGTITGEHGVGRLKRAWLREQVGGDVLALTARVKRAFDPAGLLNPGVILEPDDDRVEWPTPKGRSE